jgi:hypothetical protein
LIVAIAISDRSDNCDIGCHNTRGGRDSGHQSRSVNDVVDDDAWVISTFGPLLIRLR